METVHLLFMILTLARFPCFSNFVSGAAGGALPRAFRNSVVELRGKKQRIALEEYSRLVVRFFKFFVNI